MKKMMFISLLLALTACQTATKDVETCYTKVIDDDRKMLMTVLPHKCGSEINFSPSQPDISIKHVDDTILVIGLSNHINPED